MKGSGAEACAVCLLFSFLDAAHERKVGEALGATNGLMISLSSEVQPEFREYERFSTAVLNAYLQPVMGRLSRPISKNGSPTTPPRQSWDLSEQRRAHVDRYGAPLSGAHGALGTGRRRGRRIYTARSGKQPDIITLDMGGTSADVALIRNYEAGLSFDRAVAGFPVRLPMVDIHTVGAGGGSIAWFDRDGLLKVGPAAPAPIPARPVTAKAASNATVTDANLVLGRLSAKGLIGGRMPLDPEAARAAIGPISKRLGFTIERAALGIIEIVAANMVRAI